jgi:adenine-specific DNA-methyltransferase
MNQRTSANNNICNKKNGSYYTPKIMADFIIKRLFNKRHYAVGNILNILEPSCGDGVFIDAIFNNAVNKNKIIMARIDSVERNKQEMEKVKRINIKKINEKIRLNFFNDDYLSFQDGNEIKYDLIIANPPYIKKNYLTKKQILFCEKIHNDAGLSNNKIKNIWTAFLISAVKSLNEDGVIGFVLPSELLQVSFTAEIRDYIIGNFNKIEIFAFNELVFKGAEQDVVIILASKKYPKKIVSFFQAKKIEDLKKPELIKGNSNTERKTLSKWTNYILSSAELSFLENLKNKCKPVNYFCVSQVGIVTAANNYFILNQESVDKYDLKKYCELILQKGSFIKHSAVVNSNNFNKIIESQKPCFLLTLSETSENAFPNSVKRYLEMGVEKEINQRYKCKLRNYWYSVPSVWAPEGFFTKRTGGVPRIIVNDAKINVTDAFYRIKMLDEFDLRSLSFSFNNTLTLIYAELEGRYYGGGVLELTPNEFKKLPVPYMKINNEIYDNFIFKINDFQSSEKIREYVDDIVLRNHYKISPMDIKKLNNIYEKLFYRRLKK